MERKHSNICRCDEEFTTVPGMPQKHLPDCIITREAWAEFRRINGADQASKGAGGE